MFMEESSSMDFIRTKISVLKPRRACVRVTVVVCMYDIYLAMSVTTIEASMPGNCKLF
jgi:hypothetical protein